MKPSVSTLTANSTKQKELVISEPVPDGAGGELRSGALKLPSILMQGITHIAPAVGIVLTIQLISSLAGVTAPLAYLIAFAIVLTLGISLTQLAKHLASAGGYYTYVSRTVSPGAGLSRPGCTSFTIRRQRRSIWRSWASSLRAP